jgi:hypothetical protein
MDMPPTNGPQMTNPGMPPQGFQPGMMPPNYQRFPPMMQNGGGMRMPYPPMDMSKSNTDLNQFSPLPDMSRPPNPEMFGNQWQQDMPQPLTNLDSRVPSQKINYYGNSNGQPQNMPPPASNTPTATKG